MFVLYVPMKSYSIVRFVQGLMISNVTSCRHETQNSTKGLATCFRCRTMNIKHILDKLLLFSLQHNRKTQPDKHVCQSLAASLNGI